MKQYHIRITEEELEASIRHEHVMSGRAGRSETGTVLELIRDGLLYRRWARDQDALQVYAGRPDVEQERSQCVPQEVQDHDPVYPQESSPGTPV